MGDIVRLIPRSQTQHERLAQLEHYANTRHRRFRWRLPGTRSGKVLVALIAGFSLYFIIAAIAGVAVQSRARASEGQAPGTIAGTARVIDGDTFAIGRVRIRLFGIDAPEAAQHCLDASGESYACGEAATVALREMLQGIEVGCERRDTDRYGRMVAICTARGKDIGAVLVDQGLALAYRAFSTLYVGDERAAKAAHLGLWSGSFEPPAAYRRHPRERGIDFLDASRAAAP